MPYHFVDVELERRVVVGPRLVQVDEEEEVGPLVVLFLHVLLEALTKHTNNRLKASRLLPIYRQHLGV